jgi:serine/threonine protein kinase
VRPDSRRWIEVTPSELSHERAGLTAVREALPDVDPYRAWSNFTFTTADGRLYEVDLLVIGRSGLHLVELKHWSGTITGDGQTWWHNRHPVDNPRLLADAKAKRLRSLLTDMARERGLRTRVPFVTASVLLHAPAAQVRLDDRGRSGVYGLDGAGPKGLPGVVAGLLAAPPRDQRDVVDAQHSRELAKLLDLAGIRRSVRHRQVGTVLLHESLLAEGPGWQDYLADHTQQEGLVRRVRCYLVGRAATAEQRATIARAARREFALLEGVTHPGLARAVDFVDHERGPAVVFEHDPTEVRLDHFLAEHVGRLDLSAQLEILRTLASTIRYAHGRRLVHRRLSPRSVTVRGLGSGSYGVRVQDWQTAGRLLTSTTSGTYVSGTRHPDALTDPGAAPYLAPEGYTNPAADGVLLDVFGLGAIAYHVFTGEPPAAGADDLLARLGADGGLDLAAVLDAVPQSMRDLVYEATYRDTDLRTESATRFLTGLDAVLEDVTTPEPAEQIDPLDATVGDVVGTAAAPRRFGVHARLGRGSTAQALLVEDATRAEGNRVVLKVALDEERARRLRDEAAVLAEVRDPRVAAVLDGPLTVGGRTALLLEDAGREPLADLLRREGRLSIDLLERWGRDLLEIVQALDLVGVNHRDIKPDNLAYREIGARRERHLTLFDFSLARAPLEQTRAGTPRYLDPFFGPGRPRWDAAAERYAAAVTLYEMATGSLPVYGDDATHPVLGLDEVTLDRELFEPALADGLAAFFARALRRDPKQRFDNVAEMLASWARIFAAVPDAAAEPTAEPVPGEDRDQLAEAAGPATPLERSGLTPRAVSALTRLGVGTVGDLLARPPFEVSRVPGVSEPTRREIRRRAKRWRARLGVAAVADETAVADEAAADETALAGESAAGGAAPGDGAAPAGTSVDALLVTLLPGRTARSDTELRAVRLLLGLRDDGGGPLRWPARAQVAERLGVTPARVTQIAVKARARWAGSAPLAAVRDAVVDLLDEAGGVLSAAEVAHALLATRGSAAEDADRLARGLGLVRAAVEVELDRGGESRLDRRRAEQAVLLAREPDDPDAAPATDLLDYALALGRVADDLAGQEALPPAGRCLELLRTVPVPDGFTALTDGRLARVAAAASRTAAVTAGGEIYPVGLAPERSLRALASTLMSLRQGIDEAQLRNLVRPRYPQAAPLPPWPELERTLHAAGVALEHRDGRYLPPTAGSSTGLGGGRTPTLTRTAAGGGATDLELADLDARLAATLRTRGFLTLTAAPARLDRAATALAARFGVMPYDVTAALLAQMHRVADDHGVDWTIVLRADRPDAPPGDAANLRQLVALAAPAVEEHLATAAEPLLLLAAEPLARYDRLARLEHLSDQATARPAARLLLVATDGEGRPPHLDGRPAPTTSGWLYLPASWVDLATPASPGRVS